MPLSDGLAMPSAFDLIGHNPALQEHWIRRFIAFVIDAVIVAVVGLFFAIPLSFLGWAWWFSGIFWGGIWFIYSILLETIFGGTVGKKIVALRVVAIDRNLDVVIRSCETSRRFSRSSSSSTSWSARPSKATRGSDCSIGSPGQL